MKILPPNPNELATHPRPLCLREAARVMRRGNAYILNRARRGVFQAIHANGEVLIPWDDITRACAPNAVIHPDDEAWKFATTSGDWESGHVYFIQGRRTRLIKIGRATNLRRRFLDLRTMSADPLKLVAVQPMASRERAIHEQFAKERQHGEWFEPSRRLLDHVRTARLQYGLPLWAS